MFRPVIKKRARNKILITSGLFAGNKYVKKLSVLLTRQLSGDVSLVVFDMRFNTTKYVLSHSKPELTIWQNFCTHKQIFTLFKVSIIRILIN